MSQVKRREFVFSVGPAAAFERRGIPQHPQYGYFASFAEVYLPSGHYRISDTGRTP